MVGGLRQACVRAGPLERASQTRLQDLPERGFPPVLEQEGEPDLVSRVPRAVIPKDEHDGAAQLGRLPRADEDVERRGDAITARAILAAHQYVEALDGRARDRLRRRHESEVLGLGVGAVLAAPRDGDVELAREVGVRPAADERLRERACHWRCVEQLVGRQPGDGTADDVTNVVHPGLEREQTDPAQLVQDCRDVADPDPAELDLLSRGDVGESAPAPVGDPADRRELNRIRDPVRNSDPHHEVARRVASEEDPPPLQPLEVALLDRLEPKLGVARDVRTDVEPVLLDLDLLDLVHSVSKTKRAPCPNDEHKRHRFSARASFMDPRLSPRPCRRRASA